MDLLNNEFLLFLSCASKKNLKYLLVGGYAVNYYGYNRNTRDMDVWLEPTNENRNAFIETLICMNYSEQEVAPLYEEDFTGLFKATIGPYDASIDFLTFFNTEISFDEAYSEKEIFEIEKDIPASFVPYQVLISMKLSSRRDKDLWDVARLDELRKLKNKK
ncbi:MAG TPA: hypothetical protein VFW07_10155 [Parafilimonas sp.]|nr:hypothetical protein [Parafilimonas sp.]